MSYPSAELLALASEMRAQILERLEAGPLTVGEIADGLPVSRPAISQHLRVLEAAKLVTEEYQGTRHIYRIDPTGIVALRAWLDRFWTHSLDAFAAEVDRQNKITSGPFSVQSITPAKPIKSAKTAAAAPAASTQKKSPAHANRRRPAHS